MEPLSPPKRVTRARAAQAGESNTIRVATASSRARATKASATAPTKRRTRADDAQKPSEEQETQQTAKLESEATRSTRASRARRNTGQEADETDAAPAPVRATRCRTSKVASEPHAEPVRATRRTRKTEPEEEKEAPAEPVRKTTRTRAAVAPKSTPATKSDNTATAVKKSVKFDEPDKENVIPEAKGKGKPTAPSGIRARPVRKSAAAVAATTTTRATRGRARSVTEPETTKRPLSPKKTTQVPVVKGDTHAKEELPPVEASPVKSILKSPIKPSSGVQTGVAKKLDFAAAVLPQTQSSGSDSCEETTVLLASPARRQTAATPFMNGFSMSPRRPMGADAASPFKNLPSNAPQSTQQPSFKTSLLQSPAKRPSSPVKRGPNDSPTKTFTLGGPAATPRPNALHISRFNPTPRTMPPGMTKPSPFPSANINDTASAESAELTVRAEAVEVPVQPVSAISELMETDEVVPVQGIENLMEAIPFTGRLSSVLPRAADPALNTPAVVRPSLLGDVHLLNPEPSVTPQLPLETQLETDEDIVNTIITLAEEDEEFAEPDTPSRRSAASRPSFELRQRDEDPFQDSDSEDELTSNSPKYAKNHIRGMKMTSEEFSIMSTPRKSAQAKTPKSTRSVARIQSTNNKDLGFTPLANQLSKWMASSPEKAAQRRESSASDRIPTNGMPVESPVKNTFFDDEMTVRDAEQLATEDAESVDLDEDFCPPELDEEDADLVAEADFMSILDQEGMLAPEPLPEEVFALDAFDASMSDASEEYYDENAIPIDPALLNVEVVEAEVVEPPMQETQMVTPVRPLRERVIHTVSKVPLQPPAEDSPVLINRRCATASKVPSKRQAFTGGASPISKSTSKQSRRPRESAPSVMTTPTKSDIWSTLGTPARTPQRDVNPALLKGAVVFVDVWTSEGADASCIFIELLTQMGAKCVKTWGWNPNANVNETEEANNKIGITHVVFKDGSKRTLEKVRASHGVVLCVGVGWVLDCEHVSEWLDESLYSVDTSLLPRGGRRRRKSMEPRSVSNQNGTIVSATPRARHSVSGAMSTSKVDRRRSTQWMRSPITVHEADLAPPTPDKLLFDAALSPMPRTPAPEDIAAYADGLTFDDETMTVAFDPNMGPQSFQALQMTVPAKKISNWETPGQTRSAALPDATPPSVYNDGVMARLMLARRKSLQFAPKVGSPLAKGHF